MADDFEPRTYELRDELIVDAGSYAELVMQPTGLFRLESVEVAPGFEVELVQIGHNIQAKFTSRCDVCAPYHRITIRVRNATSEPRPVWAKLSGSQT